MLKRSLIAIAVLTALGGLGGAFIAYQANSRHNQAFCGLCHRSIKAQTEVIAEIDGRRRHVCCARCAITESYQERKPLHLIAVTDYVSGRKLDPQQAYFVDGSQKILCAHDMPLLGESKQTYEMTYDRCFPGTYAFARFEDAQTFAHDNGGTVVQLQKLMQEVAR
jgi:hypothetical protein